MHVLIVLSCPMQMQMMNKPENPDNDSRIRDALRETFSSEGKAEDFHKHGSNSIWGDWGKKKQEANPLSLFIEVPSQNNMADARPSQSIRRTGSLIKTMGSLVSKEERKKDPFWLNPRSRFFRTWYAHMVHTSLCGTTGP